MADNTTLPSGSGGDTIRTIDRTTSKTQVVGLDFGGELGPEQLLSGSNSLPVYDSNIERILALQLSVLRAIHLTLAHMSDTNISAADLQDDSIQ